MKTAISVRDITKVFGKGGAAVHAVAGVSLEVNFGELLMLMGPSGSAKTTLISLMGCILQPTSGSLVVCGEDIAKLRERELPRVRLEHIGFVFQGFNLFPALKAVENVELALRLKGIRGSKARNRAMELLDNVGLTPKARSDPADLSGGQKQRVAIARALAGEPDIILADEPTAALDSQSGKAVMEMLTGLARQQGRAVVIVTHDNRTLEYADRIVHMADGRLASEELAA